MATNPVQPILLSDRFGELHNHLMTLLAGLNAEDWQRPVPGSAWTVKEVAAHLLDTDLRRLSMQRDVWEPPPPPHPITGPGDLVDFLNLLNHRWIEATSGLSPTVLADLLSSTGSQLAAFFATVDPFAPALFPVAWAGDETSPIWFDVAREYTEKWIHQQQIREAVGADSLVHREILHPVLDTFVRAVPFACLDVAADAGTVARLDIDGDAGGVWSVIRSEDGWALHEGADEQAPDAQVRMDQDVAWRFFSTRKRKPELLPSIDTEGDPALCAAILETTSVMA